MYVYVWNVKILIPYLSKDISRTLDCVTIYSWMIDTSDEFRTPLQYWLGELII